MSLHLSQSWPGTAVPKLHQQQSLCPQLWPRILGREELRSERDNSWLTALVRKLSAFFLFYGCDLQGGSSSLAATPSNSWPLFLQQTDIFGLVYQSLCSSAVKGLLEVFESLKPPMFSANTDNHPAWFCSLDWEWEHRPQQQKFFHTTARKPEVTTVKNYRVSQ